MALTRTRGRGRRAELRLLTDREHRVLDHDLPVDASLNGDVFAARELA